jgi:hypothetical protein
MKIVTNTSSMGIDLKKNKLITILSIFISTFLLIDNTFADSKREENSLYFISPLTGAYNQNHVLGIRARVELQEESAVIWAESDIENMIKSKISLSFYEKDTILPNEVREKLIENKINYLVIPFLSMTNLEVSPLHVGIVANPVSVGVGLINETEEFDTTHLSIMEFDVQKNRLLKKHRVILREDICSGDLVDCVKDEILDFAKGELPVSNINMPVVDSIQKLSLTQNHFANTSFWIGSIISSIGFNTEIYGSSDNVTRANWALFFSGHAGLLGAGLSTIPMNKTVRLIYGQNMRGYKTGWILYGISFVSTACGLILEVVGDKKDEDALMISGSIIFLGGEALQIPSWVCFLKTKRKASHALKRLENK